MIRSFLLLVLLLAIALGSVRADNASGSPEGMIILKAVAGYDAVAMTFASIQWTSRDGGFVVDGSGTKTPFFNDAIGRVIYFDQAYFDEVDHNQYWVEWRITMRDREAIIEPVTATNLRPDDSPRLTTEEATLEDTVGRYANGHPLIDPMIAELKDQIAKLASGLVLQNGRWMSANDAAVAPVSVPSVGDAESKVTFTTKDGKRFQNARVTITETGLSVLTDNGGASISFDRLPDNISGFPKTTRDKIADWRDKHPPVVVAVAPPPVATPPAPPPLTMWGWIKQLVYNATTSTWTYVASFGSSSTTTSSTASTTTPVAIPMVTPKPMATLPSAPDLSNTVVLIKGDYSEGTGFLARTSFGPVVITNLHVIAGNPNVKIVTASGEQIVPLSMRGASDRDLAMFLIQDNNYHYLELAANVDQTATVGDAAVIPGNSEGGEVTLKTNGSLVGIGPQRVEFNNPIYHGNSGGPVLDIRTGKIVAVVTGAIEMKPTDDLDRESFANANSAIKGPMRYFGLRLDTVPTWDSYDQAAFVQETLFLKGFHEESRALDSYLNGVRNMGANAGSEDGPPDAHYYLTNEKIRKADDEWRSDQTRTTALQELVWNLNTMATLDLEGVQNPLSFYAYDKPRAKRELEYRQALIAEIQRVQTEVNKQGTTGTVNTGL